VRHRPGAWWWPQRIVFGAFFAHVALSHKDLDENGAKGLRRFAAAGYPFLEQFSPTLFAKGMVTAEFIVAGSLLVPVVPPVIGATALTAFGSGLMGVYARAPGMRRDGSLRPTDIGMSVAKDSWMVAAGLSVLIDAALARRRGGPQSGSLLPAGVD
jgi:hypothetical protein